MKIEEEKEELKEEEEEESRLERPRRQWDVGEAVGGKCDCGGQGVISSEEAWERRGVRFFLTVICEIKGRRPKV